MSPKTKPAGVRKTLVLSPEAQRLKAAIVDTLGASRVLVSRKGAVYAVDMDGYGYDCDGEFVGSSAEAALRKTLDTAREELDKQAHKQEMAVAQATYDLNVVRRRLDAIKAAMGAP